MDQMIIFLLESGHVIPALIKKMYDAKINKKIVKFGVLENQNESFFSLMIWQKLIFYFRKIR